MGIYLVDRWSILRSSVHLLYDINDAEYGFFRVGLQYEDTPLGWIFWHHETRFEFLKECRTVGNQVHGTLAIAGLELLIALKALGAKYSTLTLKSLALFNSTLAMVLWMGALRRGLRSLWVPVGFALLFTFSSPIFTKLTMLFWGTHELVLLLHGGMLCLLAGWISRATDPSKSAMRLFVTGVLAALLSLCNYSLLMPGLFTIGWLAVAAGLHDWRKNHRAIGLGLVPILFLVGMVGFFLTQSVVLRSMVLSGLDYPDRINWDHPFGLPGKNDPRMGQQPFLFTQGGDWQNPRTWQEEVVPNALSMVPSAPPHTAGTGTEIWIRWGILAAALLCAIRGCFEWIRGWFGPRRSAAAAEAIDGKPLSVYLAVYLVVAFLTITYLSLTTGLTREAIEGIRPRYYAHLYPVAFAVLACWCCARPRWIRLFPLGFVLFFGILDHRALRGDGTEALTRYDGTRAWMQSKRDTEPPAERIGYGAASAAFVDGTRILESYQSHNYWQWRWPAELVQPVHIQPLRNHITHHGIGSPADEWWAGVGYAYSILIPETRRHQFDELKSHFPQGAEGLERGYTMRRDDLER